MSQKSVALGRFLSFPIDEAILEKNSLKLLATEVGSEITRDPS